MRWHKTALNEVAKVSSGDGAPQESSAYAYAGIPFVRAGSLVTLLNGKAEDELEKISDIEAKNRKMRKFPSRTVVFAKSGMSCMKGLVYELNRPCYVVNHLAAIECSNDLEPRFLLRWFELNPPSRLIANASYPSIKLSDIRSIKIPFPPLSEQKRIAGILDAADALRAKRRESLAQLDNLIQSTFLDMFGDPVTNPMGWEISQLGDILRVKGGYAFKSTDYVKNSVLAPLIRIGDVNRCDFFSGNLAQLPVSYFDKYEKFVVRDGAILMSLTGTVGKDDYGNAVSLRGDTDRYLLNQRVAELIPTGNLNPIFLHGLLSRKRVKRKLTGRSRGVRQANISNKDIEQLMIPLPPLSLQQRFAAIVESIEKQKARMQSHLSELDTLFASLQQRAFNGEL